MKLASERPFAAHHPSAPARRWKSHGPRGRGSRGTRWAFIALLILAAPLTAQAEADTMHRVSLDHAEPGTVFSTIEAAAVDALMHAHGTADARDRGRMRIGTIYRTDGGYSYSEPIRSIGTVWSARSPVVRYRMRPIDVASYVIHPRSGTKRVDRANESPNGHQRRMVDAIDPLRRPLYLLTPTLRVLRYAEQGISQVASATGKARSEGRERILLTHSTRNREWANR